MWVTRAKRKKGFLRSFLTYELPVLLIVSAAYMAEPLAAHPEPPGRNLLLDPTPDPCEGKLCGESCGEENICRFDGTDCGPPRDHEHDDACGCDDACISGYCKSGHCKECKQDTDCNEGEACDNGTCIDAPPVSLSFTITIPRGGTDYSSSGSLPGTQTGMMYFNISSAHQASVNPCMDAALTNCQTGEIAIFRFLNTGNAPEKWTIAMSALPQEGLTLWGNSSGNATPFVFGAGAQSWAVNDSIPYSGNNWVDAWLFVNATEASPSVSECNLTHSGGG